MSCEEFANYFKIKWGGCTKVEVKTIQSWMPDYLKKKPEERKSLVELNEMLTKFDLRPEQCLCPISEMMPAFGRSWERYLCNGNYFWSLVKCIKTLPMWHLPCILPWVFCLRNWRLLILAIVALILLVKESCEEWNWLWIFMKCFLFYLHCLWIYEEFMTLVTWSDVLMFCLRFYDEWNWFYHQFVSFFM